MPKPAPLTIDPNSPHYDSLDDAATAFAATFPNKGDETAGMLYKDVDGKYRYSTAMPGTDEHFQLTAAVPKGASLGAIVHSHPGADQLGQVFSPNDLKTADQLKLPSYVRFLQADALRVYRPGVTKTERMMMPESKFTQVVARGDPVATLKAQIAEQLAQPVKP